MLAVEDRLYLGTFWLLYCMGNAVCDVGGMSSEQLGPSVCLEWIHLYYFAIQSTELLKLSVTLWC